MSLGPLMLGIDSLSLTAEERELLLHPVVGGVILFTRNYADPVQLRALTDEIRALASDMLETMYDAPGVGLAAPEKNPEGIPGRFGRRHRRRSSAARSTLRSECLS